MISWLASWIKSVGGRRNKPSGAAKARLNTCAASRVKKAFMSELQSFWLLKTMGLKTGFSFGRLRFKSLSYCGFTRWDAEFYRWKPYVHLSFMKSCLLYHYVTSNSDVPSRSYESKRSNKTLVNIVEAVWQSPRQHSRSGLTKSSPS